MRCAGRQFALWSLIWSSMACSVEQTKASVLPLQSGTACQGTTPQSLDQVFTQYFSANAPTGCATTACHGAGAGGLTFTTASDFYAATVGILSQNDPGMLLVKPGDPDHSYLYKKLLDGAFDRMPQGGPYLDATGLSEIAGWICAGAPAPTAGTGGGSTDAGIGFDLSSVTPASVTAGSGAATLALNGSGFVAASVAQLDGASLPTTYVSATSLTATVDASVTGVGGTHAITVANPGSTSSSKSFTVANPLPTLSAISPASVVTNGASFTLTLSGTGFNTSSSVNFNGSAVPTTFVDAATLKAQIPTLTVAQSYPVAVVNPAPGGGTSASLSLVAVDSTGPTITGLSPNPAAASSPFALTVTGSGYVCTGTVSVVLLNGSSLAPASCTSTQLQVSVPATAAGTYPVQVKNASATSSSMDLSVVPPNPAPTLSSLSPASAATGQAGFTLTAAGSNFVSGAALYFNGSARATTFVSATQVTAAILSSDLAAAGSYPVTVVNPSPGGGGSNSVNFDVAQSNPVPAISGLSPCGTVAGQGGFTLAIAGSGFVSSSTVTFNGTPVTVLSSASTAISASIPASLVASAPVNDAAPVVVTNPAPGGGASAPANFGVASVAATLSANVQPIFTASCATAGCHSSGNPNVPMSLAAGQSYGNTVGVPCSECPPRLRVLACGPLTSQSYLVAKLEGTDICSGTRMPAAAPLSSKDVQTIVDWIAQGAPQ